MDTSSSITLFGGLGFFLLGVHHLTEGLKGLAGDSLRRALQTIVAGRFTAIAFGAVFTALIQSSSATTPGTPPSPSVPRPSKLIANRLLDKWVARPFVRAARIAL